MRIKIFAPSYKRSEKSITQITYPFVKLVVREREADEYIKNGNDIIVCPDSAQGNISRVRNWILDNLFDDETDCIIIVDDDCKAISRWQDQENTKFSENELIDFCEKTSVVCDELGFKLWGLNTVTDKGAYREYTPFSFIQFIGCPFHAHIKGTELRYDENLPLKEDYDFTLQNIKKFGGCLRVNFANYDVKQSEQEGGCANMRSLKKEKQQFYALQKKWGKDIIKRDKGSKRSFDFNPIMKVPIKGV
jgi:hypothetical protein|tara:strand:+ start:622 stop:1365 length:744 start_codon:yes stop_codon:yes gene_type:complete